MFPPRQSLDGGYSLGERSRLDRNQLCLCRLQQLSAQRVVAGEARSLQKRGFCFTDQSQAWRNCGLRLDKTRRASSRSCCKLSSITALITASRTSSLLLIFLADGSIQIPVISVLENEKPDQKKRNVSLQHSLVPGRLRAGARTPDLWRTC